MRALLTRLPVIFILLPAITMAQTLIGVNSGSGQSQDNPGAVVQIDATTGERTVLAAPYGGEGLSGIAMASDGTVYVSTSSNLDNTSHLLVVDPATGALIDDVGSILDSAGTNACTIGDLSIDPTTGMLYGIASNGPIGEGVKCGVGSGTGGYLVSIDTSTAVYTMLGKDPALDNDQGGIAFNDQGLMYFSKGWRPDGDLHTMSTADGTFTSTIDLSETFGYQGLGADLTTGILYATFPLLLDSCCSPDNGNLYTIDPATGTVTLVGPIGGTDFVHDVIVYSGVTPAPFDPVPSLSLWGLSTLVLMLLLLVGLHYRRQQSV